MTDDILKNLNDAQREAVLYFDSPLLIIAGAGSGKTKVITNKIAYLIREKDYAPYNILGVTFTNKAANEMKSRIQDLTNIDGKYFNISTFHSLGLRILRESGKNAGFDGEWQVTDDKDQKKILERIIKENFSYFTNDMRDDVKRKISFAKMDLNYPNNKEALLERGFTDDEVKIFAHYFNYQKKQRLWDYEDLISLPVKILQNNDEIRHKYESKFRYVLVDEFQDTNPNQYELITLIAGKHKNITIVGDDDQAIYSWRGASIRFLFNYEQDFPGAHIVKLEQNYRSTPQVLEFANSLITKNSMRRDKELWTDKKDGNPVYVLNTRSKEDEAGTAADFIVRLKEEKPDLFPVAVLYRINSQSLALETEFSRRGIDFKILKGQRFFDRKEIKDSLSLFKLAINSNDDISFLRVVDFLSLGIGNKSLQSLTTTSREKNLSLFETLKQYAPDKYKSRDLFRAIDELNKKQGELKYSHILTSLLKRSGYLEILENKGEQSRLLNIDELLEFVKKWEDANPREKIGELMDSISLDSGEQKENHNVSVFLLTMHNAKGLEFPTVLVVGVNPTYMPFFLRKGRAELEEERRCLYVACTRA
ncbi:MAG: UvrD-helicase domain-containing protein, partial [bacterium]|nr:UvrD-helicase domain-containing protein [bacterium]